MSATRQSVGGFLKSSAFSLIVYVNFLFSVIFLVSLTVHLGNAKQKSAAYEVQSKPFKSGMVSLAKVP